MQLSDCTIIVFASLEAQGAAQGTGAAGEPAEDPPRPTPPQSGSHLGLIHVEAGGSLQLSNVLVMGVSPVSPLVTVEKGGALACVNSVLGPNACEGSGPGPGLAGWCCCVAGCLIARDCSFVGGAAGCLCLLDGASARLTRCCVAGSARGKGAELRGTCTSLVASQCAFRDNHLACCAVTGGAGARFRGCSFERAAESGGLAVLGEGSNAGAEGCLFADNSRSGVFVSGGGRLDLEGCEVLRNRRYAGMEVKGQGSEGRCRGCSLRDNARAELYALAGAQVEVHGGSVMVGSAALYSVWAKDPGTVVQMYGVSMEDPPTVLDGACVRTE